MSVSSRAEGEASKKGLTGAAKRQYVGGAINRARHEKAESATPAAKAKKQEHSYHREALADARSQIRYHEAQIAGLREGMKQRRELASAKPSRHGKVKPEGSRIKLTPIQSIPGYQLDATRRLDPYDIRENFGAHQTPAALSIQTPRNLSGAVDVVQERTGRTYTGSRKSRQGMYDWILDNMDAPAAPRAAPATRPLAQPKPSEHPRATARAVEAQTTLDDLRRHKAGYPGDYYGDEMLLAYEVHRAEQSASGKRGGITSALPASQLRRIQQQIAQTREPPGTPRAASATRPPAQPKPATPKRAPRPKKPPTLERQIAQAGGYVPKTPAAKLRKTPVREMTDEQLLRDWENHPPERRRGVLEREMARRQAKAAKAQQPKPATKRRRS